MNKLEPINQPKLFGLDKQMLELVNLYKTDNYPNKILFSGR